MAYAQVGIQTSSRFTCSLTNESIPLTAPCNPLPPRTGKSRHGPPLWIPVLEKPPLPVRYELYCRKEVMAVGIKCLLMTYINHALISWKNHIPEEVSSHHRALPPSGILNWHGERNMDISSEASTRSTSKLPKTKAHTGLTLEVQPLPTELLGLARSPRDSSEPHGLSHGTPTQLRESGADLGPH